MSKFHEKKIKPVLPVYLAAAAWLVCGLVLPLYRLWALGLTALVSLAVYLVSARLCPDRYRLVEVGFQTGLEDVDQMLEGIQKNLDVLHKLNQEIPDPELSRYMDRMEQAGRNILSHVEQHPDQATAIRRFANHYLPDSVKILSTYSELVRSGVKGENADRIKQEINQNAQTIAMAFENQLDALFAARSLDISADLTVLDTMLKAQGLAGKDMEL